MSTKVILRPNRADDVDRFEAEFFTEEGVTPTQWFGNGLAGSQR